MKTYNVIVSETAINDIIEIVNYIRFEVKNEVYALKIVEQIKKEISSLESMPIRNNIIEDEYFQLKEYRKLIVSKYIIFYRVLDETVYISRIVDNKRIWKLIL